MTNTNNFIELNRRYLIDDMIDSIELCLSHHIDKQTRPKLYNELSEKLCKWGVTKRSIPLIEYCFKLYINDKACFGNFNVKAENVKKLMILPIRHSHQNFPVFYLTLIFHTMLKQ